jgi:hypothetical protein
MKLSYRASWTKAANGQIKVEVSAVPYQQDVYDFECNGKSLPVPLQFSDVAKLPKEYSERWGSQTAVGGIAITRATLQDNAFAQLQQTDLAKPFHVFGVGAVIKFSIETRLLGMGNTVQLR